jgi:hypothetical protein
MLSAFFFFFSFYTTTFNSFTYEIFCQYLLYHSIDMNFTDWFTDGKHLLVIYFLVAFLSVKKPDGFIDGKCARQKKITRWNIPMELFRRWLAVAFGVILFQPSVKYRRNYSVGDLSSICSKYFSTLEYTDGLGPSVTPSVIIKKNIFFKKIYWTKKENN